MRPLSRIAAALRRRAAGPDGPHRCLACGRDFVCPIDWESDGDDHFRIWLRCGACDVWREVRVTDAEAKELELVLDRQTAQIARALERIDRERMQAELDTFVAALDHDLIDATDFAC